MKNVRLTVLACTLVLVLTTPLVVGEKGKGKTSKAPVSEPQVPGTHRVQLQSAIPKEPRIGVKVEISPDEREVINSYVRSCKEATERGHKHKRLPPGLARTVSRGK